MLSRTDVQRRPSPWRSSDDLAQALVAHGHPVSERILQFERDFGGLTFISGGYRFELGIRLDEAQDQNAPSEDEDHAIPQELVACGEGWSSMYELFIDPQGCIHAAYNQIYKRSSTAEKLIEQLSLHDDAKTKRFQICMRPQAGSLIASSLGLRRLAEVSDDCESWWEGENITVLQSHIAGDHRSDSTFAFANRLNDIVRVMEIVPSHSGFQVTAKDAVEAHTTRGEAPADMPAIDSWKREPSARCFRYDNGQSSTGVIWVLGKPEHYRVEQYRVYKGQVRAWSTITDETCTTRDW